VRSVRARLEVDPSPLGEVVDKPLERDRAKVNGRCLGRPQLVGGFGAPPS